MKKAELLGHRSQVPLDKLTGGNLGGPPPKAKYYLATDSEEVP